MIPWWQVPCTLSWSGPPWNGWTASSQTHIGYLGFGATAREAVQQMQEGIDRQPVNCAHLDGRPIGAMTTRTITACDRCGQEPPGAPRGWMRIVQLGEVPDFDNDPVRWFCPACTQSWVAWFLAPKRVSQMEHDGTRMPGRTPSEA